MSASRVPVSSEIGHELGEVTGEQTKNSLIRVMTDLFVVRKHHQSEEIHHYEEIALRLLAEADAATRIDVARKLAPHPNAPQRVLQFLMETEEEASTIMLACAPALAEDALYAAAQFGPTDQAVAVACRRNLNAELVRVLKTREEASVWRALAENRSADIDSGGLREMALRGRTDENLAAAICARCADPSILQPLFLHADGLQRAAITLEAERQELISSTPLHAYDPVLCGQLELLAWSHDESGFQTKLAEGLQCDPETAGRIIRDQHGEPLAIALASLGMSPDAIIRVFLLGDEAISHSCESIERLNRLASQISTGAARRIVRAMLGVPLSPPQRKRGHQPVLSQTAATTASRPVTAANTERNKRTAPLFLFRNRLR